MLTYFLIVQCIFSALAFVAWNKDSFLNFSIKISLLALTVWCAILLAENLGYLIKV